MGQSTVRLDLGGVRFEMAGATIQQMIKREMPDFIMRPEAITDERERTIRLALKGAVRMFLGLLASKIIQNGAPLQMPTPEVAEQDGLDALSYGALYIIDRGIELIARQPWRFEAQLERDDAGLPLIRVLGLVAGEAGMAPSEQAESAAGDGTLYAGASDRAVINGDGGNANGSD